MYQAISTSSNGIYPEYQWVPDCEQDVIDSQETELILLKLSNFEEAEPEEKLDWSWDCDEF